MAQALNSQRLKDAKKNYKLNRRDYPNLELALRGGEVRKDFDRER